MRIRTVDDPHGIRIPPRVPPRPLNVLRVLDRLVERRLHEDSPPRGGAGDREEETPRRLHLPVAERAFVVLPHERLRVGARQLVGKCERRGLRRVAQRFHERREPVLVERHGVRVVEHHHLARRRAHERVQRAPGLVGPRRAFEESDREPRGDRARLVRGGIVAHHHLEREVDLLRKDALQRAFDEKRVVVRPHEDAGERPLVRHGTSPISG